MIRVVIVDDQELVREGFALILGADEDIDVVGGAADGVAAVTPTPAPGGRTARPAHATSRRPRRALPRILAGREATRVLVLTTFADDEYVVRALS